MKNIILVFAIPALFSCTNSSNPSSAANSSTNNNAGYAYNIAHPDQWEWGDKNNIKIALNSLKAYENGNVSEAFKDYADTVLIQVDGFEGRLSKDSLLSLFIRERNEIKRMGIEMNDYESVKSKDGNSEYVSLWYKQLWQDKTGKIDSIECMDDIAFTNGKIILFNEKIRHFPQPVQ